MDPQLWQQVKGIFHAVRECPEAQRGDFLNSACGDNLELRREVESLLAADEKPGSFIDQPVFADAAGLIEIPHEDLLIGRSIGPYKIERRLGDGGMGVVYGARDTRLGRALAIKLLHPHFTYDIERIRRFQQEAKAASALNHPNILTIYEGGQIEKMHFIATELIEGRTLRSLIAEGPLPISTALDIIIQIAGALAIAHQAGIVHRDIKPENLMLRPDGIVKILDFGLAKLTEKIGLRNNKVLRAEGWVLSEEEKDATTRTQPSAPGTRHSALSTLPGILMGTVAYMSPEQARGFKVDARSDLFSLGIVLYELVTGIKPFDGETPSDIIAVLLGQEPPPLSKNCLNVPAALQRIVNRALAKSVSRRYQTAEDLLQELKSLKRSLDFSAQLKESSAEKVGTEISALSESQHGAHLTVYLQHYHAHRRLILSVGLLAVVIAIAFFAVRWKTHPPHSINSIAVLPFINVGNDSQMEYFSDGITESLIDSLMQLPSLRVKAHSSVFSYKGREVDPRQVGSALQVGAVIIGRVKHQSNQLIVQIEMADADDGSRLWGDEYKYAISNLQSVREEITRDIAAYLKLRLSREEQNDLARKLTADPDAYELYMIGRYQWNKRTPDGMRKSLKFFEQAIAKDPKFAMAYVGQADAYATLGSHRQMPAIEALPLARQAAEQALQLDEHLAEAHATLGKVYTDYDWNWDLAEKEFKRAIDLKPSYYNSHHWYSTLLAHLGRFDEAVAEANRALEIDPLSPILNTQLGTVLYRARRYDEASAVFQKILEQDPNFTTPRFYLGLCRVMQGKYEEALPHFGEGVKLFPESADFIAMLGFTNALMGHRKEALQYQQRLIELSAKKFIPAFCQIAVYIGLGDRDRSFKGLEKCFEESDTYIRGIKTDPIFDSLRKDPRFKALLYRAGFTE